MDDQESIRRTVERLHNCSAAFRENLVVRLYSPTDLVWQGIVSAFDVDHPDASTCFAWSSPVEGQAERRYHAILKKSPTETAGEAVWVSILSDKRAQRQ